MPYYIASMNIEHEFYVATKQYQPFDNLCLVDTFDLTAERQLSLFAPENTRRVERQKQTEMFVVIREFLFFHVSFRPLIQRQKIG